MPLFALKDIKHNPFRKIARYPLNREKIDALKESIQETGFWKNIVARACKGGAEIAYGHHRLTALNELYEKNHKIELIIENLSNETMLKIMARENDDEWENNAAVLQQTVRAVVEAYGNAEVKLPAPDAKTRDSYIRIAPSYKPIDSKEDKGECARTVRAHSYTTRLESTASSREGAYSIQTLATFIGWVDSNGEPKAKVVEVLNALELIDDGWLTDADFQGLSIRGAREVIRQTRRTIEDKELQAEYQRKQPKSPPLPTHVGRTISEKMKAGQIGYRQARETGTKLRSEVRAQPKQIPDIHAFAQNLMRDINKFRSDDSLIKRLNELVECKNDLEAFSRRELIEVLELAGNWFLNYAKQFYADSKPERKVEREDRLRLN